MANEGSKAQGNTDLGPAVSGLAEGRKLFGEHYTLIKIVGRGPNSVVWLAWHDKQQKDVALRFLPETVKQDPTALTVLKREVRKVQDLKHPTLVPIFDLEEEGPLVAIAHEYVEGATLAEMRAHKSNQIFSPADLSESVKQLCSLLEYAHGPAAVVHGGLSPSNLMVTQKGDFRVADFGLTRPLAEYVAKTTQGRPVNTRSLAYQSPQQANGEAPTALDDLYSFGATIYELLTSKAPFFTGDIMLQVQQKIPPPMTHRRKELRVIGEPIPRVWEETVAACLSKNPANRPQSIGQIREMLGLVEQGPGAAEAHLAPVAQGTGNHVKVLVGAGLAVLICGLLAFILATGGSKKSGTGGVDESKLKAERENALRKEKAAKEAEDKAQAAEKARRESEDKVKLMQADIERARAEDAKRLAAAEKLRVENEASLKKAKADAAELERQAKEAKLANSKQAEEKSKKDAAALAAVQEQARQLQLEIEKARAEEKLRQEAADKARKELDLKLRAAAEEKARIEEQLKKAQMAKADPEEAKRVALELEKIRQQQEARRQEEMRAAAELKAKQEAEAKQAAMISAKTQQESEARKKADAEAKKFTPGKPWENSLGMRLVPVGALMVGAWEVRHEDFAAFANAKRYDAGPGWKSPGFKQGPSHPAVNINWNDAMAFCNWLTEKERSEGLIKAGSYRLPTDAEWSVIARLEGESGATPSDRDMKIKGAYPWGNAWPPPVGAGNYADSISFDAYEETSPVGSFRPNAFGVYDLGGNVWEWSADATDATGATKALRGGSWKGYVSGSLLSSYRRTLAPTERRDDVGFRVVFDAGK